jgi:hypothetical protein
MIAAKAPVVKAMSAGSKGEAKLAPEAFSEKSLWRFFARLVGEPVLVMGDSSLANGGDNAFKRHADYRR